LDPALRIETATSMERKSPPTKAALLTKHFRQHNQRSKTKNSDGEENETEINARHGLTIAD
jgi:hypothetical protein